MCHLPGQKGLSEWNQAKDPELGIILDHLGPESAQGPHERQTKGSEADRLGDAVLLL
jgi:hypothetical protein